MPLKGRHESAIRQLYAKGMTPTKIAGKLLLDIDEVRKFCEGIESEINRPTPSVLSDTFVMIIHGEKITMPRRVTTAF